MYLRILIGTVETSGGGAAGCPRRATHPQAYWLGSRNFPAVALCGNNQAIASVRSQVIEEISPTTAARTIG